MTTPILSIITPSFNQAPYLRQTLESVAEQPVPPGSIEHIVIDGGSTDGSVEIIRESEARLAYWVSERDRGQSDAINKGLARARGRFATWLNSDDWYEPGALVEVVERLRDADGPTGFDILVGRCKFIAEGGRVVFDPRPPEPISITNLLRLKSQWFRGRLIVQPEAFFRLGPVERLGYLSVDNHYSMDHELWVRLAMAGARFATIDRHIANLRVHPGQKTSSNREVVRCLLQFARPLADQNLATMGAEGPAVIGELDSMARKLAAADPLYERWKADPPVLTPEGDPWGAAASYLDAISAHDEEWNGQRRALHGPRVQVGLAAVAARTGGLRLRSWRVLVVSADSGQAANRVLEQFPRRRLDLTACTIGEAQHAVLTTKFGPGGAKPARRGWRRLRAMRVDAGGLGAVLEMGPFDLVLTETVLMHCHRPAEVLANLWRVVRPGGFLLQAGEPGDRRQIAAYLEQLVGRLSRQISADDEVLLSHMADHFIGRVAAQSALPRGDAGSDRWTAAHPGARGLDAKAMIERLSPRPELVLERQYGAMDFQPVAPFPTVESVPPPGDGWVMTLWRRPR